MCSDASVSLGFSALFGLHWLYGTWPSALQSSSVEYNELFPIVVAAHVWGSSWFRQVVLFHWDNESVVHIFNSRTSKAPDVMHLLRWLPSPGPSSRLPPHCNPSRILVPLNSPRLERRTAPYWCLRDWLRPSDIQICPTSLYWFRLPAWMTSSKWITMPCR